MLSDTLEFIKVDLIIWEGSVKIKKNIPFYGKRIRGEEKAAQTDQRPFPEKEGALVFIRRNVRMDAFFVFPIIFQICANDKKKLRKY